MNIKTLTLAVLLLSTKLVHAENFMMVMGGGGEPTGETTIFDSTMKILGDDLKTSDWKYQVAFNGGHAKTEQLMQSQFPAATAPMTNFSPDNYKKMIADYKAKILMGEIKPGDQLMIIINTHGAANTSGREKTHTIAAAGGTGATDLNNLSGTKLVSVDDLQELVKLTNERGINLGLVDLSCHSGNTQALKKDAPNTCIITATGPKHYGYAGDTAFTGMFMKNLKKGVTLEAAFLKARTETQDASYPMISTDENNQIVAQVYAAMTPYLYYYDPTADKLTDYIMQNSKDCITCTRDSQFKTLIDQIDQLQLASNGRKGGFNGEELKRLLNQYKKTQDDLIQAEKAIGANLVDKTENFSAPVNFKGKNIPPIKRDNITWNEIINSTPDMTIASFEKYKAATKSPQEKAENQAVIDMWKQIKQKQQEILTTYPDLKNAKENGQKIVKQIGVNRDTAEKIALQEKKFYDELYRQKQSLNTNDPCRKIVF